MAKYRIRAGYNKHRMVVDGQVRIYKAGDVIECPQKQLANWPAKFELIEPDPTPEDIKARPTTIGRLRDDGLYDVVNVKTGQAVNDKPLTKEDASLAADSIEEVVSEPVTAPTGDETGPVNHIYELLKDEEAPIGKESFNVVDETGAKANPELMFKADAEALRDQLNEHE
jgi:hypothetical protein